MRNKADKGWLRELSKPVVKPEQKKPFSYNKPVVAPPKPTAQGTIHRTREFRSVKSDKSTNLVAEQNSAKKSHKG